MTISLIIDWNFNPDLFKIGSFPIKYYSLMYVLAFVIGLQLMKKVYKNEQISLDKLDSLFMYTVIAMLIGARVGHYLFYEDDYTWSEVFLPFEVNPFKYTGFRGLASHGAIIGIIIAMFFYSRSVVKKPLLWTLDRLVIPSALGAMFVRMGNLFNSEIVGRATGSEYGFRFIRNDISEYKALNITGAKEVNKAYDLIANSSNYQNVLAEVPARYPTQIYEAFAYLLIFALLWYIYWKTDKKQQSGYLFGVFMAIFWATRFIIEFFKESQGGIESMFGGSLNTGQLLSIPLVLVGLFFMFRSTNKAKA